jgi:hypothetical protein
LTYEQLIEDVATVGQAVDLTFTVTDVTVPAIVAAQEVPNDSPDAIAVLGVSVPDFESTKFASFVTVHAKPLSAISKLPMFFTNRLAVDPFQSQLCIAIAAPLHASFAKLFASSKPLIVKFLPHARTMVTKITATTTKRIVATIGSIAFFLKFILYPP